MVCIFTRSITDDLTSLVKQIDAKVAENKDKKLRAFVVLLTEDADAASKQLAELAEKHGIKGTPLTVYDGKAGPDACKISKEADVTVLLWSKRIVRANHAFAEGKLDKDGAKKVVDDVSKILE